MKNFIGKFNCDFIARAYSQLLPIYYVLRFENDMYIVDMLNKETETLLTIASVNIKVFESVREQLQTLLKQKCDAFAPKDNAFIKMQEQTTFDVFIGRMLVVAMIAIKQCEDDETAAYVLNQLFNSKEHKDVILDYHYYLTSQRREFTEKQFFEALCQ